MHKHLRHQALSFRHAINGISWTLRTQPHFQFHVVVGIIVFFAGWFFNISFIEYAILFFAIFLVLAFEMVNTAIEAIVDNSTSEWHGFAKVAKDVSAGAVLTISLGATCVGFFIFVPRLIVLFCY